MKKRMIAAVIALALCSGCITGCSEEAVFGRGNKRSDDIANDDYYV